MTTQKRKATPVTQRYNFHQYSERKLREELVLRGYSEADIESAVAKLASVKAERLAIRKANSGLVRNYTR
jgi:hypothetical protein